MFRAMIDQGAIVIYNEPSQKLDGQCGIVEGVDMEQPDYVWVRWVGETANRKELVRNLEVI
jgi:hypothetical protein